VAATKRRSRARAEEKLYRRSPFLIVYWLSRVLIAENYLTHQKIASDPLAIRILDFFSGGRSVAELLRAFPEERPNVLKEAVRSLLKYSLLERCGKPNRSADEKWNGWASWSPAATYFHFSTKDVRYASRAVEDFAGLRKLAKEKPLPWPVKKYEHAEGIQLRKTAGETEYTKALCERRTWREFSREALDQARVEELLWLSFGVQGWAKIPGVGSMALKTSPSGGSLHPVEAYVVARNVNGIAAGTYHYDSANHRLELLRKGAKNTEIARFFPGQSWFAEAAIVVILTVVFGRTQWKYEHPRAYRVVLAEAGHVCQTFCLTATWLGLAPFCTMALADTRIERALGVDGISESVVYAMGVGVRPKRAALGERLRRDGAEGFEKRK
jgi:SagB-type dehydrogenase family enzyme